MTNIRLRYAPSPTGHLHIGNARTAIFCYLWAKHYNGDFIIRIEDTDLERNIEGGIESQLKWLEWLGVNEDESLRKPGNYGPYKQTERLDIYKKYVEILIEQGYAYYSFETAEEIDIKREAVMSKGKAYIHRGKERDWDIDKSLKEKEKNNNYSIRFKVQNDDKYVFEDIVRGEITTVGKDISDFVIMKNNGIPTYNFACVIDDYLMEISHVLRGEEHISNTPKQLMIYKALGFVSPKYAHASLIVNENRKKLSKRDEDVVQFVEQYAKLGYLPEALFNFITLLGWTPKTTDEIFKKDELISIFDENRLVKSPSFFDVKKLKWINEQHIKKLPEEEYLKIMFDVISESNIDLTNYSAEWKKTAILLFQDSITTTKDIISHLETLVSDNNLDSEAKDFYYSEESQLTIKSFEKHVKEMSNFDIPSIKEMITNIKKDTGNKGKNLFMPIRLHISGNMHGPELPVLIKLKFTK